jgi:glutathione S-transferase
MSRLKLVSFDLCPYVQRAAIALAEKGVPFERITIDLASKPDWFLQVSPLGKVPVLLVDGEPIFESSVILEFLEETQPNPLHPADPLRRAQHRAWMEFGSTLLADLWAIETTGDAGVFETKRSAIADKLGRVEAALGSGPYFEGERFTLVDAVFAPFFRYFETLDRFSNLGVFQGLPRIQAWRLALRQRPSVRDAVVPDYGARLEAFLRRQDGVFAGRTREAA